METVSEFRAYLESEVVSSGRFLVAEPGDKVYAAGFFDSSDESISKTHGLERSDFFLEGNTSERKEYDIVDVSGPADEEARSHFEDLPRGLIPDTSEIVVVLFTASVTAHLDEHPSPHVIDIDAMDPNEPTMNYLQLRDVEILDHRRIDAQQARAESDIEY